MPDTRLHPGLKRAELNGTYCKHLRLCSMQHAVSLDDFVDAGCCADDGVYLDRASTDANLVLHPKVHLLAFSGLMHFRVVLTSAVLLS